MIYSSQRQPSRGRACRPARSCGPDATAGRVRRAGRARSHAGPPPLGVPRMCRRRGHGIRYETLRLRKHEPSLTHAGRWSASLVTSLVSHSGNQQIPRGGLAVSEAGYREEVLQSTKQGWAGPETTSLRVRAFILISMKSSTKSTACSLWRSPLTRMKT